MSEEASVTLESLYSGPDSTLLSWNGTTPESPNGERLAYFRMPCPGDKNKRGFTGKIWVCDRDLTNHQKVFSMEMECQGFVHNGGMMTWVDNKRLACRGTAGPSQTFYVVDTDTGETLCSPIAGSIGHYAVHQNLPFAISPLQSLRNPAYGAIDEPGIYALNCNSGTVWKILAKQSLDAHLRALGYTPSTGHTPGHIMFNFDMTRIMARGELLYDNSSSNPEDVNDWRLAGEERIIFTQIFCAGSIPDNCCFPQPHVLFGMPRRPRGRESQT